MANTLKNVKPKLRTSSQPQLPRIAILGAGAWGGALAQIIALHEPVRLWGRDQKTIEHLQQTRELPHYLPGVVLSENVHPTWHLEEALIDIEEVLIALPSEAFQDALVQLAPLIGPNVGILWATKGLSDNGDFLSDNIRQVFGGLRPQGALSGPTFAIEVAKKLPSAVTLATLNENWGKQWVRRLHSDVFRVYLSQDLIGVQVGGSVKNVLAVAAGISDGLGFGANARSALITRGLAEMMRLGLALGAQPETLMGLAGLGDLLLTCSNAESRNRRFGLALGQGQTMTEALQNIHQVVEGLRTTQAVYRLAQEHQVDMPIVQEMYQILYQNKCPKDSVDSLLGREPTYE